MTNRELQIFLITADCGKMREAAKKLFISQSSVSQAIASIEKEYGILLFERLSKGLYLTEEGRKLQAYGNSYLALKNDMESFLANASHHRQLRVGATVTVGTCVISPILKKMQQHFQSLDLTVTIANTHILEEKLAKYEIDIGLIEGTVYNPLLKSTRIINDSMVLICPPGHRFYGKPIIKAEDLCNEILVLREEGSGTRELFENQVRDLNIPLNVKWSCYNSEAIKNIVSDGHGISVISRRLVEKELKQKKLWACNIEGLKMDRAFSAVYHKDKFISDEMKVFICECESFAKKESQ